ncbi:MAG TPA: alpha/beta hydrolase [Aquihabitans sp.]|jgi:pimeloyl-ACP methyl ester carboxylesterase|nr:alpha/beta hydrolase [Aquihabitans sp.]
MDASALRRLVAAALLVAVASSACSRGTAASRRDLARRVATATTPTVARPTADVDRLLPIGSSRARMHLWCTGSGDTTVVLVAGFGGDDSGWGAVAPAVAERARVCSYARFGTGTSDAPPTDQTFATQAKDLRLLLRAAGEPGPYVVVGHSFGGAQAVTFASLFPREVEGLLLLDATPVSWPAALCAVQDDGSPVAHTLLETCGSFADPASNGERLDVVRAFAEVGAVRSVDDLPMAVLTRADPAYPGLDEPQRRALASAWRAGQQDWASLSQDSKLVPIEDTGHHIQDDQPAVVVRHILALAG